MLSLLGLEFRKLLGFRSVQLGALAVFVLPLLLSLAPDGELGRVIGADLILVSGWQVPGLSLYIVMQFVLPLLVSITCAEIIGGEVGWGTLATMLLRPVSRFRVIGTKILVAISYPFMLLGVLFLGGLFAGIRFGFGAFSGGTGLGEGVFVGVGELAAGGAIAELMRGYLIAGLTLAPIAILAVMFAVAFLNTAAAALATIATILMTRLMVVYPPLTPFLLTEYLDAYTPGENAASALVLLTLYAIAGAVATMFLFERKDI